MEKTRKSYKPFQARSIHKAPVNVGTGVFSKIYQNKRARYSLFFILLIILLGILAPFIAPYDPIEPHYDALLSEPSKEYILGTDALGRDVLSRLLYGIQVTIKVASIAVGITFIAGTFIGLICAQSVVLK